MILRQIISLWRGEVALRRVFWEYMIAWGTLLNVVLSGVALVVLLQKGPAWLALFLHFAPTPLNALLVVSVWRAAAREAGTMLTKIAPIMAVAWFVLTLAL